MAHITATLPAVGVVADMWKSWDSSNLEEAIQAFTDWAEKTFGPAVRVVCN